MTCRTLTFLSRLPEMCCRHQQNHKCVPLPPLYHPVQKQLRALYLAQKTPDQDLESHHWPHSQNV